MSETTTHFGFEDIPLDKKQKRVNDVFRSVASRYDLMNDVMSLGIHRAWKNAFVTALHVPKKHEFRHLDVAGGTGDIALRILKSGGAETRVTLLDINPDMLAEGKKRIPAAYRGQVDFVEGNAENLPFDANSFDGYSIAFGIRNVPRIDKALEEAYRVLKPGGRFLCLEFSRMDLPLLDKIYDFYSFQIIPAIGGCLVKDQKSYQYLVESIRRFPDADTFEQMIRKAGFIKTTCKRYSGGIVAVHSGWKI
jgi:ubiquinone/menaquinone biosynthesis methyltransferases